MKNRYIIWIGMACALCWSACSEQMEEWSDEAVTLGASVTSVEAVSRAVEPEAFVFSNTMNAAVWLTTTDGVYGTTVANGYPNRTAATFTKGQLTDVKETGGTGNTLRYPSSDADVYCIGMYPNDANWNCADPYTHVTRDLDGATDLMFANQISGKKTSTIAAQSRKLQFNHLLTWVKVNACATSLEAIDVWGQITSITVNSMTRVKIELTSGTVSWEDNDADNTNNHFPLLDTSKNLAISLATFGGSFISTPTVVGGECVCTLNITTSKQDGVKTKTIPLVDVDRNPITDPADTVGKLFVLNLYFNPLSIIEGVCVLTPWDYQDEYLEMS